MRINGVSKANKSDNHTTHIIGTINMPLFSGWYKTSSNGWAKKPKSVWSKVCVLCGDTFTINDKQDIGVRKCLKCKYD